MRCHIFTLDDWGRTLDVQEVECSAEEALQLGSAAMVNDAIEVWSGPRRLGRFEPERRAARPLPRLRELLTVTERRIQEGEQHISQQEAVIAQLKRQGRELAMALSILDTLIETQKVHLQEREFLVTELAKFSG